MFNTLQIHAMLEERIKRGGPEWSLERATSLPAPAPKFHFYLDLQIGPIFITIGDSTASWKKSNNPA
jgi:hypothetical protein